MKRTVNFFSTTDVVLALVEEESEESIFLDNLGREVGAVAILKSTSIDRLIAAKLRAECSAA